MLQGLRRAWSSWRESWRQHEIDAAMYRYQQHEDARHGVARDFTGPGGGGIPFAGGVGGGHGGGGHGGGGHGGGGHGGGGDGGGAGGGSGG
jgi:hypothetical protein